MKLHYIRMYDSWTIIEAKKMIFYSNERIKINGNQGVYKLIMELSRISDNKKLQKTMPNYRRQFLSGLQMKHTASARNPASKSPLSRV